MKKFFGKIKKWFVDHKPTKRRLIQVYTALLYNANIKGFFNGRIYKGATKNMCVPGQLLFLPGRNRLVSAWRAPKRAFGVENENACLHIRYYHFIRLVAWQNRLRLALPRRSWSRAFV